MEQRNPSRIAETILSAPIWAREGITALAPHLRIAAANELTRAILAAIEVGGTAAPAADEPRLPL